MTLEQQAMDELLKDLKSLTSTPEGAEFNRKNIIALLGVLNQHLGGALETPVVTLEDGTEVVEEHPTGALLRVLEEALKDLDIGLTDPVLKPVSHGANATLPWNVREHDRQLREFLRVVQQVKGISQLKKAARQLATILKEIGSTRKGRILTSGDILSTLKQKRKQ